MWKQIVGMRTFWKYVVDLGNDGKEIEEEKMRTKSLYKLKRFITFDHGFFFP